MNVRSNHSTSGGDAVGQYSLREALTIVFKRRRLILALLVLFVAGAVAISVTKPRVYRVTATLLFNQARAELPIAPTDSAQSTVRRISEEDLNSEIQVFQSRQLIERTVRRLALEGEIGGSVPKSDQNAGGSGRSEKKSDEQQAASDRLVLALQAGLDISIVKNSNILSVSFSSTDPLWAQRVVEALIDEYLKHRADRFQSSQAVSFFKQQMDDAESRLTESKKALEQYAGDASGGLLEESGSSESLLAQKNILLERLTELESSLDAAEVDLQSQNRQVESLKEMLAREPETLEKKVPSDADASIGEIQRALASLKLERDRLLQDFKPDSRHVRDIDSQISMAESRLEQAQEASDTTTEGEPNPVFLALREDLVRAEVTMEGTRAKVESLKKQVAGQKTKLEPLNEMGFELETLQRDVRAAEEDYLRYRKKHEEARISAAMDREKFINVTVAQPAQVPLTAEPRGTTKRVFLSILAGLLGGVGLAFARETLLDRTFTTAEDIEHRLGIPHIASIPDGEEIG